MRKINVNSLEEGMTLAKPLINPEGKILLAQGCALSAKVISRLEDWGFETVYVDGDAESNDEKVKVAGFDLDEMSIDDILSKIDARFCKCENKITLSLKESLKNQILRKVKEYEDARQKRIEKISQQN